MEPRRSFYRAQSPVAKPLHGAPKVHLHLVVCFPRCRRAAPRRSAIRAFFQRGENMTDNTLSSLIGRFFTEHLRAQRNLSAHTIASYRDTFRLLLQFLPAHLGVRIEALALQSLSTGNILAFSRPSRTLAQKLAAHPQLPAGRNPLVRPLRPPSRRA
ncbi:hypothetical protein Ga0100231_012445 [Opitutaceae bacterium TAV4]|nr:hypothetical protein Ga0100231_012445 [Opitutaceae bacterium TAV4]